MYGAELSIAIVLSWISDLKNARCLKARQREIDEIEIQANANLEYEEKRKPML